MLMLIAEYEEPGDYRPIGFADNAEEATELEAQWLARQFEDNAPAPERITRWRQYADDWEVVK
jgi:hypothetical protein